MYTTGSFMDSGVIWKSCSNLFAALLFSVAEHLG
jgi:hypothetical protein